MTAAPSPRARRTRTASATPLTTADAPARHLTEAQFRCQVIDLLKLHGWRYAYWPDSRMVQGNIGFPDIIACRRGALICLELKTARGRVREGQDEWNRALLNVEGAVYTYIFRPSDLPEIERVLR